ncbi:minor tail protein [Mycobacterium phage 39HC]|uniref:minor tail protein n=1 Tax=Mycobacterium phage 39HC TaxID=1463809 RepID=UPI0003F1E146|nr:minor tail protein [Mycobacterium phage 39HC]AHJ88336.1 hypothetical protein 39HC_036 [Mycobacterium phage 39HC]AHJ88436.1 hypothetical protein 40BC_036 [Mycobacterium phage 40BC]
MSLYRGGTAVSQLYRGGTPISAVYRGSTLVWTRSAIRDDFNVDGWLTGWINELWNGDLGVLFSDGLGRLVDGLGNFVGQTVAFVESGVNGLGKLVANTGQGLVDAYCGAWGGTSAPDGLVGMVNDIPIIGPGLADWLEGDLDIQKLVGQIPIIGQLGQMIGLIPDAITGLLRDPINWIVNAVGDVIGTLTCGAFHPTAETEEAVGYVIGKSGGFARLLVPDGLLSLNAQTSRMRFPTQHPTDDGWLDIRVGQMGSPGYSTQVFRRYQNSGQAQTGVGLDLRDNRVGIVRRTGGANTIVKPALTEFGPGTRLRLHQAGNVHTLYRDGIPVGDPWNDATGTAARGSSNRSVAMVMSGSKELFGVRRFSPSLDYIEAA